MKIKISDIANGKLDAEQSEALQKYFQEGGTWQDLLEFSQEQAEGIYAKAYDHYQKKELEQALAAFAALIQLNPYEPKYWMGMGATMQLKEEYEEALAAYQLVLILNEKHIGAHFASAQCTYAQGLREKSIEHLQKVMLLSADTGQELELASQSLQILHVLQSEKEDS